MDRRMLINAVDAEECRIAIIEGSDLLELEIESNVGGKLKGNIYKAKISRIEPSLQAAFLDIGTQRNGFLQINDIHPSFFRGGRPNERAPGRVRIQDVLDAGQELVVQVVKEERELKGATLTTYLSLPGRYLVVMPGSDRGGISRKINDAEQRKRLKKLARELEVPTGIGMIIRTAGLDRSQSELSRDLSLQLKLWERIVTNAQTARCPEILYKESDLATRVIRDYFTPEIREILIDDVDTYNRVREFVGEVMPRYRSRVRLYDSEQPIFSHFNIEQHVEETLKREVKLPSGGAIVVDSLEALVAIDVNSGKATTGESIEETAYRTNLEAADMIAHQLRLRDLGGLIVIDFIDMLDKRHRAAVERRLQEAVRTDKARVEIGRLSQFGLLEMSRQRLRASLASQSHSHCPHCHGSGKLKNAELVALEVLRKIQAAVVVGHVSLVKARVSPGPALFLLNNKKAELAKLESVHRVKIFVLADGRLRADEYEFEMESAKGHHHHEPRAVATAPSAPAAAAQAAPATRAPQLAHDEDEEPPVRPIIKNDDDSDDEETVVVNAAGASNTKDSRSDE
ncbi:MAG: Rne/Rng family ribonuclease [Deltaproteobacteria bacterium]|nr:Rne/Rng family ribonuclease [Deltaproteobacteria bacterium]